MPSGDAWREILPKRRLHALVHKRSFAAAGKCAILSLGMRSTSVSKGNQLARVYRSGDVSVVEFCGHINGHVVTQAVEQLEVDLAAQPALFLIIDCTAIEGYSPDVRSPGVALLKVAKRYGVLCGACVAPSAAVRMMGAAVAFVSSLPFDFVETRALADQALKRRRDQRTDH